MSDNTEKTEKTDKKGMTARTGNESVWLFDTLCDINMDIRDSMDLGEALHKLFIRLREIASVDVFYVANVVGSNIEDDPMRVAKNPGYDYFWPDDVSLEYKALYIGGREIDFELIGVSKTIPADDLVYRCFSSLDGFVVIDDVAAEFVNAPRQGMEVQSFSRAVKTGGKPVAVKAVGTQLAVCLGNMGRITGAFCIRSEKINAYDRRIIALMDALSFSVSMLLDNAAANSGLAELKKTVDSMAKLDILTDIPNRRLLFELVPKMFAHATRTKSKLAFLYMDLDNFKSVNDSFGHAAGDEVLRTFRDRVLALIRSSDIFARVGGDEFIVVMTDLKINSNAGILAGKIIRETSKPMLIKGKKNVITVSIGVSVFPEDGGDTDTLIELADKAMYCIKQRNKGNYMFFGATKG